MNGSALAGPFFFADRERSPLAAWETERQVESFKTSWHGDALRTGTVRTPVALFIPSFLAGVCHTVDMVSLTNKQISEFKARGQLLKPMLKVGKEGLTPQFIAALDEALKHNELLKVKFADLKDQKKALAPQLAEKTGSYLIMRVGNVVVLYRPQPIQPDAAAE